MLLGCRRVAREYPRSKNHRQDPDRQIDVKELGQPRHFNMVPARIGPASGASRIGTAAYPKTRANCLPAIRATINWANGASRPPAIP